MRLHLPRLATLACFVLGLMGSAQAATLNWAAQNDILTLDPHAQDHNTTNTISTHIYEGLTRLSEAYKPEPSLATKWTYTSPTLVRFELRKGVKFHDGSPFTADDVVFSFERISQPQGTKQIFVSGIKEVKKIDALTVDFVLEAPTPMLLTNIVSFSIMSKTWAEKNKATRTQDYKAKEESFASRNAMGTGPYKLVSWVPDQRVAMVANADWWGKSTGRAMGNVTELNYLPIKSEQTRVAALLAGDVDIVTDLPPQDIPRLKRDGKLKLLEGNEVRTIFFAMDQGSDELRGSDVKGKNPFKDKRVREAMSLAIDRVAIQRSIMRGLSQPAALMVAPGVNGHTPELDQPLKPDPDKAKQLLADAGYDKGFEVPLHCPNNRYVNDEEICQAVVSMWARMGIKAKLIAQPFSLHSQTFQRFESPLYLLGWGVSTYDAQYALQAWGRTKTTGADGSFNFARVSDAPLDELIDAMKHEPDVAKRNALIRDALIRVRDEVLYIPIHHQIRPWAMKTGVATLHRSNDYFEGRFTTVK